MHPELRRARSLYFEWRRLPDAERARSEALAHDVKELALDLRGQLDPHQAERDLARANDLLGASLPGLGLRAA